MGDTPHLDCISQGSHHVILPHELRELLGTPPAGNDLITFFCHEYCLATNCDQPPCTQAKPQLNQSPEAGSPKKTPNASTKKARHPTAHTNVTSAAPFRA